MKAGDIKGRQKTFAEKVAEGHTATEAYLLAGYRPIKRETAHRAASRLYANPGIRNYIRELRRTGDELAREETTLTIARKLAFLARLVLTSSATLREDDPLIQSHRLLKDGSTSIRIPCKLKALKMHSELAGHFLPEPTEPPPPVDSLQILFDQIRSGRSTEPQTQGPSPNAPSHQDKRTPPPISNISHGSAENMERHNDFAHKSSLTRPGTSGDADLSKTAHSPTTPASKVTANHPPEQKFQTSTNHNKSHRHHPTCTNAKPGPLLCPGPDSENDDRPAPTTQP